MNPSASPKTTASLRFDLVGGQWPAPRPGHERVDVAVEIAVDRVGAAGRERPADQRPGDAPAPVAPVDAGHPARREDHRRHRRDEQQLDDPRLGQRDIGADPVTGRGWGGRPGRLGALHVRAGRSSCAGADRTGRVVAGHGQPDEHREDHRAQREVKGLRPCGERGDDLQPADRDLDRIERRGPERKADERRVVPLRPPGDDGERGDDHTHDRRDPAVEHMRRGQLGQGRDERPVHQRPVGEDQRRVGRGHVRPEQQQRERREGGERGEKGKPLAAAPAREVGREAGPNRHVHEQRDQQHRRRQVGRDRLTGVAEADGLAPEPGLEADQGDGADGRPQQRAAVAMVDPGKDRQADDLEPDDRGDGPVGPLDPGLGIVERRQQLAVAQRPVGAAETGVRGADDHADRDQQDRGPEGPRGELLEAGQGISWGGAVGPGCSAHSSARRPAGRPRRPRSAGSATLRAMTHRSRAAILFAVLLGVAACSTPGGATTPAASPSGSGAATCPTTAAPSGTPEGWNVAGQKPSVFPQIINPAGTVACGPTRLMFSFLDEQNVPVAKPDRTVDVRVFDLGADPATPVAEATATFIWAIEPRVASMSPISTSRRPGPTASSSRRRPVAGRRRSSAPSRTCNPHPVWSRSATRRPLRTRPPSPTSAVTCRRSRPMDRRCRPSTRRRSPTRSQRRSRSSSRSPPPNSACPSNADRRWTGSSRSPLAIPA